MDGSPQDKIAIGTITEVHGPVATIACNPLPPLGRALSAIVEQEPYLFEVHQQLQLIRTLTTLQTQNGPFPLIALYHTPDAQESLLKPLLPPFQQRLHAPRPLPYPPLLNLSPEAFFSGLVEQYLFATLHEIAYVSLMAENQRRLRHLDGAVRHLDEQSAVLARRGNSLRQEEIIEEIEVILLGSVN
ncbi:F0F1 ATP synthase subunit gamma [Acidithiobacillus ferrooxidans]|uniref:F0F1 ATP synthase subunit gamma n=1 Tax=Acidithiobacillus ferrooxidans TaxID=920 RepID=UPI001EF3501C|nr:F0F1 ATP synthase subunit gamma [Acidithiobacillus ferrooxidans]MCR2831172.1 F0F1 ATP synthase subunit gamma [Acidithiobacillus ferrooxidans]